MGSMHHGFEAGGDSGNHTTQVPDSPRFPFHAGDETAEAARSLDVHALVPGATITVATRNSTYRLVLRAPSRWP